MSWAGTVCDGVSRSIMWRLQLELTLHILCDITGIRFHVGATGALKQIGSVALHNQQNVQSNWENGRITASCQPLRQRMPRALGRRTVHNTLIRKYVRMGQHLLPSKVPLPVENCKPYLIHGSLEQLESTSQAASRMVQPFQHSSYGCVQETTLRGTWHV